MLKAFRSARPLLNWSVKACNLAGRLSRIRFSPDLRSLKELRRLLSSRRSRLKTIYEAVPARHQYSHCLSMAEPCSSCGRHGLVPPQRRRSVSDMPDYPDRVRADLFECHIFAFGGITGRGG